MVFGTGDKEDPPSKELKKQRGFKRISGKRKPWTVAEKAAVKRQMGQFLNLRTLPKTRLWPGSSKRREFEKSNLETSQRLC